VDHLVWCRAFRPGFPALTTLALLDDPRYQRRDWQMPLRMHACVTGPAGAPRRTSLCALTAFVCGPTAASLAAALNLLIFHGVTPLAVQWWCASQVSDDAVCDDADQWIDVRAWLAARLWRYADRHGEPLSRFDDTTSERLLAILRDNEEPMTLSAFALLARHGADGAWSEACGVALWRWDTLLLGNLREHELSSIVALAEQRTTTTPASSGLCLLLRGLLPPVTAITPEQLAAADFGALVVSMNRSGLERLLSHVARVGPLVFWARLIHQNHDKTLTAWLGPRSTVVYCEHLGPLGHALRRVAEAVDPGTDDPLVVEAVVDAICHIHGCYPKRFSDVELPPDGMSTSDLVPVLVNLVTVFQRHYDYIHRRVWPLLGDVHPDHLSDVAPDAVCTLLRLVDGGTMAAAEDFLRFIGTWVIGFGQGTVGPLFPGRGPSVDGVWERYVAPQAAMLERVILQSKGYYFEGALTAHGQATIGREEGYGKS
jgi:hypothetical protein